MFLRKTIFHLFDMLFNIVISDIGFIHPDGLIIKRNKIYFFVNKGRGVVVGIINSDKKNDDCKKDYSSGLFHLFHPVLSGRFFHP